VRALPGRRSRLTAPVEATVTRGNTHHDQISRILRALAELVAARGYGQVTVNQVVRRAHVSQKTFYRHFPNKEEALVALFDTVVAFSEEKVRERLGGVLGDRGRLAWAEQIITVLRTLVEQTTADPVLAHVAIVAAPTAGPVIRERHEKALNAYAPLIRAGREFSPRGSGLPETLEVTVAGSVSWVLYERLLVGEAESLPQVLPEMIEVVLRAYIGEEEARRLARAEPLAGWNAR
jgi:AcrR family transcriptional regulator